MKNYFTCTTQVEISKRDISKPVSIKPKRSASMNRSTWHLKAKNMCTASAIMSTRSNFKLNVMLRNKPGIHFHLQRGGSHPQSLPAWRPALTQPPLIHYIPQLNHHREQCSPHVKVLIMCLGYFAMMLDRFSGTEAPGSAPADLLQ